MNTRLLAGAALAGLLLTGAGCYQTARPPAQPSVPIKQPVQQDDGPITAFDMIEVSSPLEDEIVSSPVTITGRARGYWYFEASFPIHIYDANDVELGVVPAQAQGDWMTEDWVPFSVQLTFDDPTTETGTLVLKKDNPSGLPENDKELVIPIRFEE